MYDKESGMKSYRVENCLNDVKFHKHPLTVCFVAFNKTSDNS